MQKNKLLAAVALSVSLSVPAFCQSEPSKIAGNFVIRNNTTKTIKIGVGNFLPTKYTLSPGADQWVFVSTDNQDVTIYSAD